jgi:hypothetical protein
VRTLLRKLLPPTFGNALGVLLGAIAILALLDETYHQGFVAGIQALMDSYKKVITVLFGWLTPFLEHFVREWLSFEIKLHPIWAHVSVISGIYLLRNVYRLYANNRIGAATYQLIVALPIMLLSGMGAGIFYREDSGLLSELAIPAFPILGIFTMLVLQGVWFATYPVDRPFRTWPDFNGSWSHFVLTQTLYAAKLLIAGLGLALLFTILLDGAGVPMPSVIVMLLLVSNLALYWLTVGAGIARISAGPRWRSMGRVERALSILETQAAELALGMFRVLIVVLWVVAMKAGEAILGL